MTEKWLEMGKWQNPLSEQNRDVQGAPNDQKVTGNGKTTKSFVKQNRDAQGAPNDLESV